MSFFLNHLVVSEIILALLSLMVIVVVFVRYKSHSYKKKQREYRTIISQALIAITNAIEAKDSYTKGHSARVAAYSVEIARRMGMGKDFIENLYYIGLLHDVGKIGIPDEIINKPDKLTDEEYETLKTHSYLGKEILKDITVIKNLTAGAAEHHERWDGKGYYQNISGDKISLEARIVCAADTYDAMSSNRSYRKALPKQVILEEFKKCKGKQFEPEIADIVIDMIEKDHFDTIDVGKILGLSKQYTVNKVGSHDGFIFELYKDTGNAVMTLTGGGGYKCEWSGNNVVIFRTGQRFDETKTYAELGAITIDFGVNYRSDGIVSVGVNGWSVDPLIEFHILESWETDYFNPGENPAKGSVVIDGSIYDLYEYIQESIEPIRGNKTYKQYWSIRRETRTSGIISVTEHFKAWENIGMGLGNMLETAFAVRGLQSSGVAEVYRYVLTIGGTSFGTAKNI